CQQGYNYPFTF
nr:immunoglobulin light chain junction region [Macaca mulatta]